MWLLLENVVDQNLKDDEERDDDVVSRLKEGTALCLSYCTTPQHGEAPVNVLLRLLYRFDGTLKFTEVCTLFPQPTVMLVFVSLAPRRVVAIRFRRGAAALRVLGLVALVFSLWHRYLVLAIVPPRPLVTQTNKTARTYHRGAVSDFGLDAAVFLELNHIVERIPRPRVGISVMPFSGEIGRAHV